MIATSEWQRKQGYTRKDTAVLTPYQHTEYRKGPEKQKEQK